MKENKIRKTHTLDKKVYQEFQIYDICIGRSVSSLIEEYMRNVLKEMRNKNMNKNMKYKLREDKQDEFIENYEYQSYKYANKDDCYYLKISKHLILDQDKLEILAPTNKLEEEDIDLLAKLEANNMLEFYKKVE